MKRWIPIFLALAAVACGSTAPEPTPRDQIGLVEGGISDIPTPPAVVLNETDPGGQPTAPAPFADAPPVVSHGVAEFLPISRDENMCIDCHMLDEKVEGEPTPIPESHYVDLRNRPDVVNSEIAGARYVCTACHIETTETTPLVPNRFGT